MRGPKSALSLIALAAAIASFASFGGRARGDEAPSAAPKPRIALQLDGKLAIGFLSSGASVNAASSVPPALIGIRYGRFTAQLGFSFQRSSLRVAYTSSRGVPTDNQNDVTVFTCDPTLTVDLYRTADRRASIYLLGAALLGGYLQGTQAMGTASGAGDNSSNFVYGYQFAVGARVAVHSGFSLGIEAGPIGLSYTLDPDLRTGGGGGNPIATTSSSTVIYSALVGSFTLGD